MQAKTESPIRYQLSVVEAQEFQRSVELFKSSLSEMLHLRSREIEVSRDRSAVR